MRYGILVALLLVLPGLPRAGQSPVQAGHSGPSPTQSSTSGITGRVVVGPQCPVVSSATEEICKDKLYQATLVIRRKETLRQVARVTADRNGMFQVVLPPGTYVIEPFPGGRPLPFGRPEAVSVLPGKFTDVTIRYDTGIR